MEEARNAVLAQESIAAPPTSAMMLGNTVTTSSTFIECSSTPPESTASGGSHSGFRSDRQPSIVSSPPIIRRDYGTSSALEVKRKRQLPRAAIRDRGRTCEQHGGGYHERSMCARNERACPEVIRGMVSSDQRAEQGNPKHAACLPCRVEHARGDARSRLLRALPSISKRKLAGTPRRRQRLLFKPARRVS